MKYRIELTDVQLNAVIRAVNLMMRTGTGQTDDLMEWIVTQGDNIKLDTSTVHGEHVFMDYYHTRTLLRPVLDSVVNGCWNRTNSMKSDTVRELETIYLAFRHQEWLDSKSDWDVRAREPMKLGKEPIPKIERVE